jgi:predicted permease
MGWFRRRRQREDDLQRELQSHLAQEAEELRESGMANEDARFAARKAFGNPAQLSEEIRDAWRWKRLGDLFREARQTGRMLRRNPGFTLVVVITLALGIGANTAMFSVMDAVLLQSLPFRDAGRLVLMSESNPSVGVERTGVPWPDFAAWKTRNQVFEEMAAYWSVTASDGSVLSGAGAAARVGSTVVTNGFLPLLGVTPAIGRGFLPSEEKVDGGKVFLISDGLWRRSFGASRDVLGRSFRLDGETYTLIGVLPAGFQFPQKCEVWESLSELTDRQRSDRISHPFRVLARVRNGVSVSRVQAEMDGVEGGLAVEFPQTAANWRVQVTPLREEFVGGARRSILVLFGAVVFVLLIACANVLNLLLARMSARQTEFAVRAALGAGRGLLLRQTLVEGLLIACISTTVAILIATWGLRLILRLSAGSINRLDEFHLNGVVLVFTLSLTVVAMLVVGLAPVLQVSGLNLQDALRQGQRGGFASAGGRRFRAVLVVGEVALTLLLLAGAGLMLRSYAQLRGVSPGFDPDGLVTMRISLPDAEYPRTEQRIAFLHRLLEAIRGLPQVQSVAAINTLPFSGETNWGTFNIVGRPALDWARAPSAEGRAVTADYFNTMGIPLLRGRQFSGGPEGEVIINAAMARRFWPGANPIGERMIFLDQRSRPMEIVGVVGNVKDFGLDSESEPQMYVPVRWWGSLSLVLRGSSNMRDLVSAVRVQTAILDKGVPVYEPAMMNDLMGMSMARRRFELLLLGLFAALAMVLAATGVYGLLSFGVSRRRHEIGVRLALGASRRDVLWLIVRQGMSMVGAGVVIGLVASAMLTRLAASLLYEVSPTDPLTLSGVALILALVGLAACYVPARRAMGTDPMAALRQE